jgi:hypothetical protein
MRNSAISWQLYAISCAVIGEISTTTKLYQGMDIWADFTTVFYCSKVIFDLETLAKWHFKPKSRWSIR